VRIVCPFAASVRTETLRSFGDAVRVLEIDPEFLDTSRSDTAYAELIMALWGDGESFLVVEADMAFEPGQLQALIECERSYCASPYVWSTNVAPALGFTAFKSDLLAEIPVPRLGGTHYRQVDVVLMRFILGQVYGRQPHLHLPPVRHVNEKQALRPEFEHLTLAEHLAALGYEISEDGKTAEYMHPTREFGDIGARA
jgi:hypothetical protein